MIKTKKVSKDEMYMIASSIADGEPMYGNYEMDGIILTIRNKTYDRNAYMRDYMHKNKQTVNKQRKDRYQWFLSKGKCPRCFGKRKLTKGKKTCDPCRIEKRNYEFRKKKKVLKF